MKRHPQLRGLSDDHHSALVVALRCKRASEATVAVVWQAVRASIPSQFEPHFLLEEEHLLPALAILGEHDMVRRIREDHARLRELGSQTAPALEAVREFGRILEDHVRFEEREVFEQTQDRLPAEMLAALERACEETPRTCPAVFFETARGRTS